jgi:hypothetical protein
MAHLVETMAYTGQTPWHELGHALPVKQSIDVWACPNFCVNGSDFN